MKALITRKVGMTSTLDGNGAMRAVTLLSASQHVVLQKKTVEKDGYTAVQVGSETNKNIAKPLAGHAKAAKASPKIVKEFRDGEESEMAVGDSFDLSIFAAGDVVHATGTSKGKGFSGTIKRHNFHRGRKTHGGQSYRRPGSIGSMYPQKIFKGKRMAGQMGHEQVTVQNLEVAFVDSELNVIGVYGAVPGPRKSLVIIKEAK